MGRTLYESGPLTVGEKATPSGRRLQVAITGADRAGLALVECGEDDARELLKVLVQWLTPKRADHVAPKQIAIRSCGACGHVMIGRDVSRLDEVKARECDQCGRSPTNVYLYDRGAAVKP